MLAQHRRVIKRLKLHAPGLQAVVVRENRHVVVDFILLDAVARITMSKSPCNPEHEYRNACSDVCKALGLAKIVH